MKRSFSDRLKAAEKALAAHLEARETHIMRHHALKERETAQQHEQGGSRAADAAPDKCGRFRISRPADDRMCRHTGRCNECAADDEGEGKQVDEEQKNRPTSDVIGDAFEQGGIDAKRAIIVGS